MTFKYRTLIEKCFKEYDLDDEGDKTWTTSSEWNDFYTQKKLKSLERKDDKVRIVCISKDLDTDKEVRKLYVKEPVNGFDKTFEENKAKIFTREEAENYLSTHQEQIYPKENLKVSYEIETV